MAGLLDGYRAAMHWACYGALEALGVQPGHERVVVDRNRFTGNGVTASIDFGLMLLAELRGHPRVAGPELTAAALAVMGNMDEETVKIAKTRRQHEAG